MPLNQRVASIASCLAVAASLAACDKQDTSQLPPADLIFSVRAGGLAGPDSAGAGWARVRVEEDGGDHRVVIFRLAASMTDADLTSFLAAFDTAKVTPAPVVALGGPEIGTIGDVVVQFTPGRYLLGCVMREGDGHRHASTGESKVLVVTNTPVTRGRDNPPVATQDVPMVDFAYVGPDRWRAGSNMLRVHNDGRQDHLLILARLRPGSSLQDWMNADGSDDIATPVAGVARIGPGAVAYLPVDLPPGDYVAYCLITDPSSGRNHVQLGMVRAIHVE